jgi:hypothetical protein
VHKTLNNNLVELDVGYERFLGPEMFFHPVRKYLTLIFLGIHPQGLVKTDRRSSG